MTDSNLFNAFNKTATPSEQVAIDCTNIQGLCELPLGNELLDAQFTREGQDLLVNAPSKLVVAESYFTHESSPTLISETGKKVNGTTIETLSSSEAPLEYAGPTESPVSIGSVEKLQGSVTVKRGGMDVELKQGDAVYQNDVVQTSGESKIGITFEDGSVFSLGSDARMTLDSFVYDAETGEGSSSINVIKGMFKFVSGEIAANNPGEMQVETPVATIGIRGTTGGGSVQGEGMDNQFYLEPNADGTVGWFDVTTDQGTTSMNQPNTVVGIQSFHQAPPPPVFTPPEQIQQNFNDVINFAPSGKYESRENSAEKETSQQQEAGTAEEQAAEAATEAEAGEAQEAAGEETATDTETVQAADEAPEATTASEEGTNSEEIAAETAGEEQPKEAPQDAAADTENTAGEDRVEAAADKEATANGNGEAGIKEPAGGTEETVKADAPVKDTMEHAEKPTGEEAGSATERTEMAGEAPLTEKMQQDNRAGEPMDHMGDKPDNMTAAEGNPPPAPEMGAMEKPITMTMSGEVKDTASGFDMAMNTIEGKMDGMMKEGMSKADADKMMSKMKEHKEKMLDEMMEKIESKEKMDEMEMAKDPEANLDEVVEKSRDQLVEEVLRREKQEHEETLETKGEEFPPLDGTAKGDIPPFPPIGEVPPKEDPNLPPRDENEDDAEDENGNDDGNVIEPVTANPNNNVEHVLLDGDEVKFDGFTNSTIKTAAGSPITEADISIHSSSDITATDINASQGIEAEIRNGTNINIKNDTASAEDHYLLHGTGNNNVNITGNGGNDEYHIGFRDENGNDQDFGGTATLNTQSGDEVYIHGLSGNAEITLKDESTSSGEANIYSDKEFDDLTLSLSDDGKDLTFKGNNNEGITVKDTANANYKYQEHGDQPIHKLGIMYEKAERDLSDAQYLDSSLLTAKTIDTDTENTLNTVETIEGSVKSDTITTTGSYQNIKTYDGDDTINVNGLQNGNEAITINAGGGNDTVKLSNKADNISIDGGDGFDVVDLSEGFAGNTVKIVANFSETNIVKTNSGNTNSNTYEKDKITGFINHGDEIGDKKGPFVNSLTNVEAIITGGGNDIIKLGGNITHVNAGAGGDEIYGKAGTVETVSYATSGNGVTVDLGAIDGIQNTYNNGDASGDKLSNIENLVGSSKADTLDGNSGANELHGGAGNDSLNGHYGNDILVGGEGNDALDGGAGNDILVGGEGNDTLDGGAGTDTVSYEHSMSAVDVDLTTGSATGEGTDSIRNVEKIIGSSHDDIITLGTMSDFTNDSIDGGSGFDTVNITGMGSNSFFSNLTGIDKISISNGTGETIDLTGLTAASIDTITGGGELKITADSDDTINLNNSWELDNEDDSSDGYQTYYIGDSAVEVSTNVTVNLV